MAVFFYDNSVNPGTTAVQLFPTSIVGNTVAECSVTVQNDHGSTNDAYMGTQASQSYRLKPGDTRTVLVMDARTIYVKAQTGTARVNGHVNGSA